MDMNMPPNTNMDAPAASYFQGTANPYIHVAPRSLAAQKLAPASYPEEAEIFCSLTQCDFGLTRGLVIGGDAFGMAYAPLEHHFDSTAPSGHLYVLDAFGGFQVLRGVDGKSFMNAQLGYRTISFNDGTNDIVSQGVTVQANYAQVITPFYLQGVSFSGFFVNYSTLNNHQALLLSSPAHGKFQDSASYFYRSTEKYPTYQVSFPADVEVANWGPDQTHLDAPLRTYAHVEPFYAQNNLNFSYNNISLLEREQNFGVRVAGTVSYESKEVSEFGRYALLASLGADFQTSTFSITENNNTGLDLPKRSPAALYANIAASWAF